MRQYLSLFAGHPAIVSSENSCAEPAGDVISNALENKNILRQIARSASDFVTVHRRAGEVDDCTFSTDNFHGLQRHDLLAGGFLERLHIADRPACLGAFSKASIEQQQVLVELRLRCPSSDNAPDAFCWIELTCSAFAPGDDDAKDIQKILCVGRDITRFKEREEELFALEQAARELIESKTRFLTNMSHELRTPLNAIIGFSEMMKLPGITAQNEQQMVEYAGIIHDSGRHLLGVVDEVLDMSQFEAGKYKPNAQVFSIADLVSASVELVQFEAEEKGVHLIVGDFEKNSWMNADRPACKQALVGLLAAQIKAEPENGRVYLAVSVIEGFVGFTTTGLEPAHQVKLCRFSSGSQLSGFVELLHGSLNRKSNASGQNEAVLKLPQGDLAGLTANVVSIGDHLDDVSPVLKKTA